MTGHHHPEAAVTWTMAGHWTLTIRPTLEGDRYEWAVATHDGRPSVGGCCDTLAATIAQAWGWLQPANVTRIEDDVVRFEHDD